MTKTHPPTTLGNENLSQPLRFVGPGRAQHRELCLGTTVRINHFAGVIVKIETHIALIRDNRPISQTLTNRLYTVRLDKTKRIGWVKTAKQVYIDPHQDLIKVFADEMELICA